MNRKTSLAEAKIQYMINFEQTIIALAPQFTGKIDWNSALNFYLINTPVKEAAEQYVLNRTL